MMRWPGGVAAIACSVVRTVAISLVGFRTGHLAAGPSVNTTGCKTEQRLSHTGGFMCDIGHPGLTWHMVLLLQGLLEGERPLGRLQAQ